MCKRCPLLAAAASYFFSAQVASGPPWPRERFTRCWRDTRLIVNRYGINPTPEFRGVRRRTDGVPHECEIPYVAERSSVSPGRLESASDVGSRCRGSNQQGGGARKDVR